MEMARLLLLVNCQIAETKANQPTANLHQDEHTRGRKDWKPFPTRLHTIREACKKLELCPQLERALQLWLALFALLTWVTRPLQRECLFPFLTTTCPCSKRQITWQMPAKCPRTHICPYNITTYSKLFGNCFRKAVFPKNTFTNIAVIAWWWNKTPPHTFFLLPVFYLQFPSFLFKFCICIGKLTKNN